MTSPAEAESQPLVVVSEGHRVGHIRFNRPAKLNPLSSAILLGAECGPGGPSVSATTSIRW